MTYQGRSKSNAWFLLPVFLGLIGGIIAFFILRQEDPTKAKNCLYLGIVMMLIGIIFNIVILSAVPGIDSGFNVNM